MSHVVLGIDPGLTRCGFGVVRVEGNRLEYVDAGVIKTPAADALEHRLTVVWEAIGAVLEEHRPDAVAVERVYAQANLRTVMGTAQVSGLAVTRAALAGIRVVTYTPTEMKAAVTGSGRADKAQVTTMVQRLLRLAQPVRPADASDALGLAICHCWRGQAQDRIAMAVRRAGGAA